MNKLILGVILGGLISSIITYMFCEKQNRKKIREAVSKTTNELNENFKKKLYIIEQRLVQVKQIYKDIDKKNEYIRELESIINEITTPIDKTNTKDRVIKGVKGYVNKIFNIFK